MKVSEQIAIIKAYEDGKTIERRAFFTSAWKSIDNTENYQFNFAEYEYRIKPEQKYRPYESLEEAFKEAEKHGFWVKSKDKHSLFFIDIFEAAGNGDIYVGPCHVGAFIQNLSWFGDSSPCGVTIE